MRADPNPNNGVTASLADSAILFADTHRPDVFVSGELLEAE
jgi:hypothetical protein